MTKKKNPNRLERKLRKRPGLVWFELLPFISGTVLQRWAVVKSHTRHY